MTNRLLLALPLVVLLGFAPASVQAEFQFGLSKVDITPQVPLRLSGYGNRDRPSEGIDESLQVRAMAMSHQTAEQPGAVHVLVSVDTIGFPGVLTKAIHEQVEARHGIPRSRFVICCTHSHTAPHVGRGLTNLFNTPLTAAEEAATNAYTDLLAEQVLQAVTQAIENLQPGRLFVDQGTATFARNRRVLRDGIWTGFGENPEGPVDHTLPILRITDLEGKQTRGIVFNYACHCTTFGGDYNRVNGDWAGYAAKYLEETYPDAVALCTIGCGADANPERVSARALEIAQAQGREIAEEVERLITERPATSELKSAPQANYGYAGLPIDRPSDQTLQENLQSTRPQVRHHAEVMIETKRRMGRLPETYPMPIQVWRFGDEFTMVFLGGEVCVDYALRLQRELPEWAPGLAANRVWVTAYANDVFAYVAPERMRAEAGYEVDFSMIYYLQPGRWSSGTEEVIIRRVRELFESRDLDVPLSLNDSLKSFQLPDGYEIELVAAEPLIRDPINFAVDARGQLWVVEMGDYPRGHPQELLSPEARRVPWDGPPAGTIKVLTDTNGDGRYDTARIFLDGLSFPTGVFPWGDGVFISGAPDLLFARDTNGDGRADDVEVVCSGFEQANPQHRVSGFEYGLDGWLYLSSGTNNHEIRCLRTHETVNVSGRDFRLHPVTGKLEPVSGRSQFGRCRDDYQNWYGNNNSQPLFQYVIEDRLLSRNPHVPSPSPKRFLTQPANAPPVYPTSRTLDRFNDLHALDRFTSACGPLVVRNRSLGDDLDGAVLICEPVHNLVSRVLVDRSTIEFTGRRHPAESQSEFLTSTDNWFRPTRLMTAPDGGLWVCDMYRHVIEHPEWIPEAWQARLNLYAGHDRGRIYRVFRTGEPRTPLEDYTQLDLDQLLDRLQSPNGWQRDMAQQQLLARFSDQPDELRSRLPKVLASTSDPRVQVQISYLLSQLQNDNHPRGTPVRKLYLSENPDVVIAALRIWGAESDLKFQWQPLRLASHPSERVRFELALAAGDNSPETAAHTLSMLLKQDARHPWIRAAILSSANQVSSQLLATALDDSNIPADIRDPLLATLLGNDPVQGMTQLGLALVTMPQANQQRQLLLTALEYLERRNLRFEPLLAQLPKSAAQAITAVLQSAVAALSEQTPTTQGIPQTLKLASFAKSDFPPETALRFLDAAYPPEVTTATIQTLTRLQAAPTLLQRLRLLTPAVQAEILATLLTSDAGSSALLTELEQGRLTLHDLTPAAREALETHRNVPFRERFASVAAREPSRPSRAEVIEQFQPALTLSGDHRRGQIIFGKTCSSCHRLHEIGNDFGPQLGVLGQKPDSFLLTSILDPNAAVEAKYRAYVVATLDGKVYSGLIAEETATSLKLIRPDGKQELILRADIEEISNTGRSFMPEGLEKDLTPQDLSDLLAFLRRT